MRSLVTSSAEGHGQQKILIPQEIRFVHFPVSQNDVPLEGTSNIYLLGTGRNRFAKEFIYSEYRVCMQMIMFVF